MGGKSADAPDYRGAAEEQGQASQALTQQQTVANRPNQYTPWGSSEWQQGQGGQWTQNINLDPSLQAALDSQQNVQMGRSELAEGLINRTGQELDDPFNWGGVPQAGQAPQAGQGLDPSALTAQGAAPNAQAYQAQDVQRGLDFTGAQSLDAGGAYNPDFAQTQFDRQMSLMGPQMEQSREMLDSRLRNQGLRPGTEAYDRAMKDLQDQQGEMTTRLTQDSMRLGADEQQRQFGREMGTRQQQVGEIGAQGQFANQATNQAVQQQLAQGGQRFGEGMALANLSDQQRAQQAQEQLSYGQQRFQQEMGAGSFQNQLRQQGIAEEAQRRGMSINEMNALLTGQQVQNPAMPQFAQAGAAQTPNYLGAAQAQGNFDLGNQQNAFMPWQMLGNMGGQALGSMTFGG